MNYLTEDGQNYLNYIKDEVGSWGEIVFQLFLRSIKTSIPYLSAHASKANKNNTFPNIRPDMVIPLCELVNNKVKPEQLRPDVFLSTTERHEAGIISSTVGIEKS